ncbi:MAG: pentose kinase [Spirochaetales bacterium]|nr:MAG: pentose kinase [Spirochaetales bacterium]
MGLILSFDLGTGGNKASIFNADGKNLGSVFVSYDTYYPGSGLHEQRPEDWWLAVVESTRKLLALGVCSPGDIECLSISGHSLGAVPVDRGGRLLREKTPIWSDTRAVKQAEKFFSSVDRTEWYMTTGNGFPAECYTVFKILWYRDTDPDMFAKIYRILGTKDYINMKLTGRMVTDFSYASGSGVYDLTGWGYADRFIEASGLPEGIFPEMVPSAEVIGVLSAGAAESLGLPKGVRVACGGVDNSCMALGAGNTAEGRVYTSLGSSAWIAVSSSKPVLDAKVQPFVFTHVLPGMFTSAVSIFSAGRSFRWLKDTLCRNIADQADGEGKDAYELMTELAEGTPIGSRGLMFNPSLAGGTSLEPSFAMRGGFSGIDLKHTQADVIRSVLEGVAINLGAVLRVLKSFCALSGDMVLVGGGSRSRMWRRIFADVFNMRIIKSAIDQEAASLGAAALGAVASGLWKDVSVIDRLHKGGETEEPDPAGVEKYGKLSVLFEETRKAQAAFAAVAAASGLEFLTE